MKTVDYIQILRGVAGLAGTSEALLQVDEASEIQRIIDRCFDKVWNHAFWPDITLVEQRYFRPVWAAGSYALADERYYTPLKKYYVALKATTEEPTTGTEWAAALPEYSAGDYVSGDSYTTGNQVYYDQTDTFYQRHTGTGTEAPTDTTYWGVLVPFERTIDYTQSGESEIGTIDTIYVVNPSTLRAPAIVQWLRKGSKAFVTDDVPFGWVSFRKPAPALTGSTYSATATYAVGDQIYFTSNFYDCITATSAGESPTTTAAKWQIVDIPYVFKRYLIRSAFAEFAAVRKREFKRLEWESGELVLEELMVRQFGQEDQQPRTLVSTR